MMDPVTLALGAVIILLAIVTGVIVSKIDDLDTLRIGARLGVVALLIVATMFLTSCGTAGIVMRCIAADRSADHC